MPDTIADNCSSDVTQELAAWITSNTDATLELGQDKCYLVSSMTLDGVHDISLEGNGSTIERINPAADAATIDFEQGQDVTLENLTISGGNVDHVYNESYAFDAGIRLAGTDFGTDSGFAIEGVTITDAWGDGITLSPYSVRSTTAYMPTTNVTIIGSTISGTGRMGIGFVSCAGVLVEDDALANVALDTFDLEADVSGEGTEDLVVKDTTSGPGHGIWFSNVGSGGPAQTGEVYLVDNTMQDKDMGDAILIQAAQGQRGPYVIENNTLRAGAGTLNEGIELFGARDVYVYDNHVLFYADSPEYAMGLDDTTNVVIDDNEFENAAGLVSGGSHVVAVQESGNSCPPRSC